MVTLNTYSKGDTTLTYIINNTLTLDKHILAIEVQRNKLLRLYCLQALEAKIAQLEATLPITIPPTIIEIKEDLAS